MSEELEVEVLPFGGIGGGGGGPSNEGRGGGGGGAGAEERDGVFEDVWPVWTWWRASCGSMPFWLFQVTPDG